MGDRTTPTFRTIEESAQRCGAYCWVERRLFVLTGTWASAEGDPVARVFCSAASSRHAGLAAQWHERLPMRSGMERRSLVVPTPDTLGDELAQLEAAPSLQHRLQGLVSVVLPRLLAAYEEDLASCSPVNEEPVAATLELAVALTRREISLGEGILGERK
jgi:hypothetical protein